MHSAWMRSRRRRTFARRSRRSNRGRCCRATRRRTSSSYYLELLDDARFNPAAYGSSLGLDLSGVAPAQPLAMNPLLVESARLHSQDMIAQNYFSHTTPAGRRPRQRIAATGLQCDTGYAESIEYQHRTLAVRRYASRPNYAAWDTGLEPLRT